MQKVLIGFVLLALASCGSAPKRPEGVLTQTQLAGLLIEIYLAEARTENVRLSYMTLPKDSSIRYFLPFEEKLFKSYGVSDSTMKITYSYYLAHPKELENVYDAVVDTLALREKRALQTPEPKLSRKPLKR